MESITIKMDEDMAQEMEKFMKPLYSTKTEFIREAIRDKINSLKTKNVDDKLLAKIIKGLEEVKQEKIKKWN